MTSVLRWFGVSLVAVTVLWMGQAAMAAPRAAKSDAGPAMEPYKTPLSFNDEFVEVSAADTLRTRYHSRDFDKDMEFYLAQAKENSKGRKPGTIKMVEIFLKEIDVIARHKDNPDGKIEGVCNIPDSFITEHKEFEKTFSDFVYAYSNGAVQIKYLPAIVSDKPIKYDQPGEGPKAWWFRPKFVEEQFDFLKDYKAGDADFMFFFLHTVKINGGDQLMWPAYGGMAWGNEEIKGTRLLTLNDHELARNVHEWEHHIFDTTIQETEDMTVTRFHGLDDAGYGGGELGWGGKKLGPCLAYYRDCIRYYMPRDMWERWQLKGKHNIAHETYSGKGYEWSAVKNDYWFKLPRLGSEQLAKLTGLKSVKVEAPDAAMLFKIDAGEKVLSPRIDALDKNETALNNAVEFHTESAAVIKTATGTWLFVKPQLMDFYVNMLKIKGAGTTPLPVYGYVLEGEKALLALKLPADMKLPAKEAGFFR